MWAFLSVSACVLVWVHFLEFRATELKFKSSQSHSRMLNAVEISRDCRETVKKYMLYIFKARSVFINTAMESSATHKVLHKSYWLRCLALPIPNRCLLVLNRILLHSQGCGSWLRLWGLAFRLTLCFCLEVIFLEGRVPLTAQTQEQAVWGTTQLISMTDNRKRWWGHTLHLASAA